MVHSLWKNRRAYQLRTEPFFAHAWCKARSRARPLLIISLPAAPTRRLCARPAPSLCGPCHDALSGFVHKPYRPDIGADGYPLDSAASIL